MRKVSISDENAISMIALIVTIVVILLLSAITIGILINNNGIITRSVEATNEYQYAMKKEYEEMEKTSIELSDNNLVKMFRNGDIKVGDYVNYPIPENGEFETKPFGDNNSNGFATQKYDVNNNGEEINWRILGVSDRNGKLTVDANEGVNILLISGSPVQKVINEESENEYDKNPYLFMGKAEGYENASNILNGICEIYRNNKYSNRARSINVDDINTILGIEVDYDNGKVFNKNDLNTNIDYLRTMGNTFSYNLNTYSPYSYANSREHETNGTIKSTSYSYSIGNVSNTIINNLLFSQNDINSGYSKAYWLDSKGIDVGRVASFCIGKVNFDSINIGNGEFKSNGKWNVHGFGVYPIIYLKSNITNDEIQVISKSEEEWEYKSNLSYYGNLDNYYTTGTELKMFQ